ncbi:MAG: ABC transporter ATP-binding protein [Xanthomonadales bacterium]|nr:ABC transporter ATP-binding protein [Gammaproteobacteria bacterium]NND55795.1 ABC transporter ATP-binding protein [Xanthomonadales bacterium]
MSQPVLKIRDLSVSYQTEAGPLQALRDVTFAVPAGKIIGIVGESGCGKSTLISTIIRLIAPNARIGKGSILFKGDDLLRMTSAEMRALRGDEISMVFQDPMTSLNPVRPIGRQMADVQHRDALSRREKNARSESMLGRVGIPDPAAQLTRYPHQLSGGMRQRVAIAMALMAEPSLLIADEPTTALDATLEVQIIHRLQELQRDFGCSILFISHHLGVIAELCDEVVVMYAGEVVESGPMRDVFLEPRHPYTRKLLECDPARIAEPTRDLPVIEGSLPNLVQLPDGCIFRERCPKTIERCGLQRPRLAGDGHQASCHLLDTAE